jgi:hypothetical protein
VWLTSLGISDLGFRGKGLISFLLDYIVKEFVKALFLFMWL